MSRFFERHRAFDVAATLLVVILAVSVADIHDYEMYSSAMRLPFHGSTSLNVTAEFFSPTSDSGSGSGHDCSCLLCVTPVSDSFGPRVPPPSAGKLLPPIVAGIAGSPHLSEVFHPPSA